METKDLVLNIAVNLGRFARWAVEGRRKRIEQFIMDTNDYMEKLEKAPKTQRFNQTFLLFKSNYASLIKEIRLDESP